MPNDSSRTCWLLSGKFFWDERRLTAASELRICSNTLLTPQSSRHASHSAVPAADAFQRLDALATSWGLTQIMGYEVFDFSAVSPTIEKIQTVEGSLQLSSLLLARFAQRWNLDLAADCDQLFDAWNTGRPHAPTADPAYIPKGLARMAIYEGLPT